MLCLYGETTGTRKGEYMQNFLIWGPRWYMSGYTEAPYQYIFHIITFYECLWRDGAICRDDCTQITYYFVDNATLQ